MTVHFQASLQITPQFINSWDKKDATKAKEAALEAKLAAEAEEQRIRKLGGDNQADFEISWSRVSYRKEEHLEEFGTKDRLTLSNNRTGQNLTVVDQDMGAPGRRGFKWFGIAPTPAREGDKTRHVFLKRALQEFEEFIELTSPMFKS